MTETRVSRSSGLALLGTEELPTLPIDEAQCRLAVERALTRTEPYDLRTTVFEHVARSGTPDAVAVTDEHRSLSYAQLAMSARRAASLLAGAGVTEGDVVAVGGPRGVDVLVGFLAIELLGAVYLPVDQDWPARRIEDVLGRAGAAALFAAEGAATELREAAPCPVLAAGDAAELPAWQGDPGEVELAYLLYTSGSTGAPKGAVVERRGMLNHLHAKVQDLGVTAADRIAQTAPLVFDISLWQLLTPLLAGARVDILPDDVAQNAAALLPAVRERGITVLELVPTLLRLMLDELAGGAESVPALRWLLATGEELPPATATRVARQLPGIGLLNAYGPTECSDDVTHHVVGEPDPEVRHLPIGGPVANTDLYVLRRVADGWESCATGEPGELFVGGTGVGRGYHADPARTREAFFRDPFAATPTGRLYRTGDAVVALPGGVLEFRGRVDRQVKIAGFRMEPAEIEAVLAGHPGVAACAVTVQAVAEPTGLVARETKVDGSAAPRLHAFTCPVGDPVNPAELRDYLAERLPLPMVPQRFTTLTEMPLTHNGKVDLKALAALAGPAVTAAYAPPQGPAETAVCAAMADLLGVEKVGRDDSFLGLGGDSLLAINLVARLRDAGHLVTMRDVLLGGTPAEVAAIATPATTATAPPPTAAGERRERPLTPQQSGVYFHWRLAPDNPYYNYQGSITLTGPVDPDRLAAAWQALLTENPVLRARFLDDGEQPRHEYPHWDIPLGEPVDLSTAVPAERERRYREEAFAAAATPFDLLVEPVLRVTPYRMSPTELRLLLTTHEIMLDGWGTTVLCRRLAELYADPVVTDTGRYDRYLDWESARRGELDAAGEHWRRHLAGELPVLDLPTDAPRPANPSYRGGIVEELVDEHTTRRIRELGAEAGLTPFMLFLGAYTLALGYYGGADEVVVGAPIANRERPEQLDVAAFLLNMLPFRVRVDPAASGREYLESVRETVVSGYAAAEYPFGWMLRDLPGAARETASTPVFQTMLNVITYPAERMAARDVTFGFTEMESGFVKYDCSMFVQAHGTDRMLAQLDYHLDVLSEDTARRLLESTVLALDALTDNPDVPVREIDLMPAADRTLLEGFTDGS